MKTAVRLIPAPLLMFLASAALVLALTFIGLPVIAMFVASGLTMLFGFLWMLICLVGVAAGKSGALMGATAALTLCAAAITVPACFFYYGAKLMRRLSPQPAGLRISLANRDVPFA